MLKILHRYILLDMLKTFILSTSGITLFLSLAYALSKLRDTGLGPIESLQLIGFFIPAMLIFAMPVAALLTTTLVYGRLAANNELIACRSSGISMTTMLYPVLLLGLLIGGINYMLFDRVIPWARYNAENVGMENMERIFFHSLRTKREFDYGNFYIRAQGVADNTLYGVVARYGGAGSGNRMFEVFAPAATVHFMKPGEDKPDLAGATIEPQPRDDSQGPYKRPSQEEIARREDVWDAEVIHRGTVWFSMIGMHAADLRKENELIGRQIIRQRLDVPRVKEPEEMTFSELQRLYRHPRQSFDYQYLEAHRREYADNAEKLTQYEQAAEKLRRKIKAKALAQMHSRTATIVSCVLLVGLGAVMGIHFRHGHMLTAFFISMGPAMFAIFAILLGVQLIENNPQQMQGMALVTWSGNVFVAILNCVLMGRLLRQ